MTKEQRLEQIEAATQINHGNWRGALEGRHVWMAEAQMLQHDLQIEIIRLLNRLIDAVESE